MSDEKHTVRNGIIIGVSVIVIAAILGILWSWFVSFIAWVVHALSLAWVFALQSVTVPKWLLGLLLIPAIYVVGVVVVRLRQATSTPPAKPEGPRIEDYNADTFYGMTWRWDKLSNLTMYLAAFCPDDGTRLVSDRHGSSYRCETCLRDFGPFEGLHELQGAVERQIERKVNRGEWRNVVIQSRADGD